MAISLSRGSPPQNPPTRHHYIPQFLIRRWAGSDRLVERFMMPVPSKVVARRVPSKSVGWWEDLYRSPELQPDLEQHLEEGFFKELDNKTALVLEKLNQPQPEILSAEEISTWSTFLMSLLHRTPENLSAAKEAGARLWQETMSDIEASYDELRGEDDPATFEQYVAAQTPEDVERSMLRVLPKLMTNPNIGGFINGLNWQAFDRPADCYDYMLSDDPLSMSDGLKKDNGHMAIVISPKRLLVGAYKESFLDEVRALRPSDLVSQVNRLNVERARHFVVATDRSQQRFVENRFGAKPRAGIARRIGLELHKSGEAR